MALTSANVGLWVGFSISLFATVISGLELAFNVYAIPLKERMNFTQTQVEIIASMGTIGMSLSCLETICTWLLGYKVTCLIIVIGMPVSSGLFSLVVSYNAFFHSWPSVVGILQLIQSTANSMAYVAISRVFVEHLPKKHMGKIVGLYLALCCSGKIYFAALMELFFEDNLAGFFLSLSVTSAVAYGSCFIFLYPVATNRQRDETENRPEALNDPEKSDTRSSAKDMLKSAFFHLTFWPSVVFYGSGYTCLNNVTTIGHSVGMEDPLQTVFLLSVVIIIIRLTFGTAFDKFSSLYCGFALMTVSYSSFVIAMIIGMLVLDTSWVFPTTIFIGIGMAPGLTIPVSMLLLRFGRSYYSAITGCFYTITGICQILLQVMFGFWYDLQIKRRTDGDIHCYGRHCFYWSFMVLLIVGVTVWTIEIINCLTIVLQARKKI